MKDEGSASADIKDLSAQVSFDIVSTQARFGALRLRPRVSAAQRAGTNCGCAHAGVGNMQAKVNLGKLAVQVVEVCNILEPANMRGTHRRHTPHEFKPVRTRGRRR